jgi:hypothetical protein
LEKVVALAQANPQASVYYSGWRLIDKDDSYLPQAPQINVIPPQDGLKTLLRNNYLNCSSILMRREAVLVAGSFDINFRRLQDWEFWLRLARTGHRFVGLPECLTYYRIHGSSLSTDPSGGQRAAMALAVKHFGPDDGQWQRWPADKRRMFGGVYRYHALTTSLIRGGDWSACARYLRRALLIDPSLAYDLDLFYELALGTQTLGQRGANAALNVAQRETELRQLLNAIFTKGDTALALLRRDTAVTAWYALALVAYNAQAYSHSRQFLRQLWQYKPLALMDRRVILLWLRNLVRDTGSLRHIRFQDGQYLSLYKRTRN